MDQDLPVLGRISNPVRVLIPLTTVGPTYISGKLEVKMSIFKKISDFVTRTQQPSDRGFLIYVKCARCGEKIRSRVDLYSDLSIRYEEEDGGEQHYFTHKTIIGNKMCFSRIEVDLTFNNHRQLIDRSISGGEFITEEEFRSGDKGGRK